MPTTAWQALEQRVRTRPSDPLVTFIADDGARTELSAITFANNVAKAANALADEVGAGSRIGLHLPWHWQRAVWAMACWAADCTVVPEGDPAHVDLLIAGPDEAPGLIDRGEVWVVSLHPLGLAQPVPAGAHSAAAIAMAQPDALLSPSIGDHPALGDDDQAQLLALAAQHSVPTRFAVIGEPADPLDRWLLPTLVPLTGDASIVMLQPSDDADRLIAAEAAVRLD